MDYPITGCAPKNEEPGKTWISNAYIRNQGLANPVYDVPLSDCVVNNPPPTLVFVRVAPNSAGKMVYWINGWQQPRLKLTKGRKYQFNVVTPGHPFVFKHGDQILSRPTDYFTTTITIAGLPDTFEYACALHPGMGGQIQLI